MNAQRFAVVTLLILTTVPSIEAVEPWADTRLTVTEGLELWLDASRIEGPVPNAKPTRLANGKVSLWPDASGKGRHVGQAVESARPTFLRSGETALVRFDGEDDHLRFTGPPGDVRAFTLFVVTAPRATRVAFAACSR